MPLVHDLHDLFSTRSASVRLIISNIAILSLGCRLFSYLIAQIHHRHEVHQLNIVPAKYL